MVGSIRSLPRPVALKVLFAGALLALTLALGPPPAVQAEEEGCAFPFTPTAYEDLRDRNLFLSTIELAAFNMLFPGDPYFGLTEIEMGPRDSRTLEPGKVPPVLLKAIAYIESSVTQADGAVPFGSVGPALVAFDCGHGITQVTTGMTVPEGEAGRGSPEQALVATHFAYNIARGARILLEKWNAAPDERPIAGTDTMGHPAVLENWYFAVWSYNGFTGPGANRSNHPMDPVFGSWPRTPYSCGPGNDGLGHNRNNYPYQELVFGCATNPPLLDGKPLWQAQAVSLPNLNDNAFKNPLKLESFVFPYSGMDIPSPKPLHLDSTPAPDSALRDKIIGSPKMGVSSTTLKLGFTPEAGSTTEIVDIFNTGTGVMAWYAIPSASWITLKPYTGVAVGTDMKCESTSPCDRVGHMEVSIDATKIPAGARNATITVQGLGTSQSVVINVQVSQVVRLGAPGITSN